MIPLRTVTLSRSAAYPLAAVRADSERERTRLISRPTVREIKSYIEILDENAEIDLTRITRMLKRMEDSMVFGAMLKREVQVRKRQSHRGEGRGGGSDYGSVRLSPDSES